MWVAITLVIIPVLTSGLGCKPRVARNSEIADTATCVSAKEYKARKAQVYRCQLRLSMAGYKDRTRTQACLQLGCSLQPPQTGSAPGGMTVSTTLLLLTTTIMTFHVTDNKIVTGIVTIAFLLPTTAAIGMEELGARREEGMDVTDGPEWEERMMEVKVNRKQFPPNLVILLARLA